MIREPMARANLGPEDLAVFLDWATRLASTQGPGAGPGPGAGLVASEIDGLLEKLDDPASAVFRSMRLIVQAMRRH